MNTQLESLNEAAFEWFLAELSKAPFCHVEPAGKSKMKCRYMREQSDLMIPAVAGVYVVYHKENDTPFYAGEGRNLRQRIKYHFSESKSAKLSSTLKNKAKKLGLGGGLPTHELFRFKYVPVPFGRKEIEELFHCRHGINTKGKKKREAT